MQATQELAAQNATTHAMQEAQLRDQLAARQAALAPNESASLIIELDAQALGEHEVALDLRGARADDGQVRSRLSFTVPDFARADYGHLARNTWGIYAKWER